MQMCFLKFHKDTSFSGPFLVAPHPEATSRVEAIPSSIWMFWCESPTTKAWEGQTCVQGTKVVVDECSHGQHAMLFQRSLKTAN